MLESPNPDDFDVWVPRLMDRMAQIPQITDVATELQNKGLSMFIKIDRDAAARFGITAATVDNLLYDAFGQRIVSTVYTQSNQYRVIYEVEPRMAPQPRLAATTSICPARPPASRCRCRPSPPSSSAPRRCGSTG